MTAPAAVASFCTGVGGLDMGLEMVLGPVRRLWYSEFDRDASKVLERRYPGVPNIGDLTKLTTADWAALPRPEILTAGFPCQDLSAAGKRAGIRKGTRSGVWAYIADAIGILQPEMVIIENVLGLLSSTSDRGMGPTDPYVEAAGDHALRAAGRVLGDLADLGFDAEWQVVGAAEVGATHRRLRVFIKAWPAYLPRPRLDRWSGTREAVADATSVGHGYPGTPGIGWVQAPPVSGDPGSSGVSLLPTPTPTARDAKRGAGWGDEPGRPLSETIMRLLPTPAAARSGRQQSQSPGAAVRPSLDSIHHLLPTPAASRVTHRMDTQLSGDGRTEPNKLGWAIALLPTPAARLGESRGTPSVETAERRMGEEGRRNLEDAIALLPTPRASDGAKGGPNQRGSKGDLMLPSAVIQLLPTPTVADSRGTRNATAGRTDAESAHHDGWTLGDVAHANRWGVYAPAVARWEAVTGVTAPAPTEPGHPHMATIRRWAHTTGLDGYTVRELILRGQIGARLSATFVEWMVGLPAGWVTDILDRSAALKCLGNIAMPHQTAHAVHHLMTCGDEADPARDLAGEQRWRGGDR